MALPKKGSRTLNFEGHTYRYAITEGMPASRYNSVTVQSDSGRGQKLLILFPFLADGSPPGMIKAPNSRPTNGGTVWTGNPDAIPFSMTPGKIVTMMKEALDAGWAHQGQKTGEFVMRWPAEEYQYSY